MVKMNVDPFPGKTCRYLYRGFLMCLMVWAALFTLKVSVNAQCCLYDGKNDCYYDSDSAASEACRLHPNSCSPFKPPCTDLESQISLPFVQSGYEDFKDIFVNQKIIFSSDALSAGLYVSSGDFTLDLNGLDIQNDGPGSPITISGNEAKLTLQDRGRSDGAKGTIRGKGTDTNHTSCVSVNNGGEFEMKDGILTNCGSNQGAGVSVMNNSTFTLSGGTITGNKAAKDDNIPGTGGGVMAQGNSSISMNGGTISANTADLGGGVAAAGSTFTMSAGTISGNSAGNGAAVFITEDELGNSGTFILSGGTISGNNITAADGCNVAVESGSFIIDGNSVDTNNSIGSVCLGKKTFIQLGSSGSLSETVKITVRTEEKPTLGNPVVITGGLSGKGSASNFVSAEGYKVSTNNDGEVILVLNIGIDIAGKGELKFFVDGKEVKFADAGDTVTIQATPGTDGYVLTELKCEDSNSQPVTITNSQFTMPDGDVTVQAIFEQLTVCDSSPDTWDDLARELEGTGCDIVNITLSDSVTYNDPANLPLAVPAGKTINLDLNGKKIDRNAGEAAIENGYVIKVEGKLILKDTPGGGTITGGNNSNHIANFSCGGGILVNGTLVLQNGTISGNKSDFGGGVYIAPGGKFTMEGGTITCNELSLDTYHPGYGGGVYIDIGTDDVGGGIFIMNDGTISKNKAYSGGGVYVGNEKRESLSSGPEANFRLTGKGTITLNEAKNGGGVWVNGNGVLTMSGGTFSENTAETGGGVFQSGTIIMKDGKITSNKASDHGGGVYFADGTFKLSGSPIIQNNTRNNTGDNVAYPSKALLLTITGELSGTANVGLVNPNNPITQDLNKYNGSPAFFFSDDPDYAIRWNSDQTEAILSQLFDINIPTLGKGKITADYKKAAEGDPVTLTVTPDTGYQLKPDSLTVACADPDDKTCKDPEIKDNSFTMPAGPVTVSAEFVPVVYSISYELDGGKLPEGKANPVTYTFTTATFTLNNPEKTGFDFAGWCEEIPDQTSCTPSKEVTIAKGTTGNKKFSAKWTEQGKVLTPEFDPSAGEYNAPQQVTISCGTENAVIHYTTDGTEPTLNSPVYSDPIAVTADTVIRAFAVKEGMKKSDTAEASYTFRYSITVKPNDPAYGSVNAVLGSGGKAAEVTLKGAAGEKVALSAEANPGYRFTKWESDPADAGSLNGDTYTIGTADVTITAVFEAVPAGIFTVNVRDDGHGTASAKPSEGPEGTQVTLSAEPKDGYRFKEWRVDPADAGRLSGNTYTIGTANVTITAFFEKAEERHHGLPFFRLDGELPQTGITAPAEKPLSVSFRPAEMELLLPTLDVTSRIVTVPEEDGVYPVQGLGMDAGLLEGTDLPGEGISVIAAHNTVSAEEYGPFARISMLEKGDRFLVRASGGDLLIYEVYRNEKIGSHDREALWNAASAYDNTLTLLTCEDEQTEGGYASRRIVSAARIK